MKRPWHIAIVLAVAATIAACAMGWLSLKALELDRQRRENAREALLEESVRLALWHMDSLVFPLLMQESTWPHFAYRSFYYPNPADKSDPPAASPLLNPTNDLVRLNFMLGADDQVVSPQVPPESLKAWAINNGTTVEQISDSNKRLIDLRKQLVANKDVIEKLPEPSINVAPVVPNTFVPAQSTEQLVQQPQKQMPNVPMQSQEARNTGEFMNRQRAYSFGQGSASPQGYSNVKQQLGPIVEQTIVKEGTARPIWIGDQLLLARRVNVDGQQVILGSWLDWPKLREWLTTEVRDRVGDVNIQPVAAAESPAPGRMLVTLPAKMVVNPAAFDPDIPASPIPLSLAIAWACVLLAMAAVAALVIGVVTLSERRAAFVSAVTHELRTPLTTFRMYAEMLADGMVPDEEQRRTYLQTLKAEADRLTHLVGNVLAYARLERGRPGERSRNVPVAELIDTVQDRLEQRAHQADLKLEVNADDATLEGEVRCDPAAVEQILFNLVDNACKYAATATDRTLHLELSRSNGHLNLRVRDHGPGVNKAGARRLFEPFHKSATEAAHSAPGVGLGLALSRRLARDMQGDLQLDKTQNGGASFVLTLPAT